MRLQGAIRVALLAVCGLGVAIVVAVLARHLVSQPIGLADQPVSAGRELAPPTRRQQPRHQHDRTTTTETTRATPAVTTPTTTAPYTGTTPASPSTSQPDDSHSQGDERDD